MQWSQGKTCSVTTTILGTPVGVRSSEACYENVWLAKMSDESPYRPVRSPPSPPSRVTGGSIQYNGCGLCWPLLCQESYGISPIQECLHFSIYLRNNTSSPLRSCGPEDLSSEAFIWAIRRFLSRRGFSEGIISDNAKNFKDNSKRVASLST